MLEKLSFLCCIYAIISWIDRNYFIELLFYFSTYEKKFRNTFHTNFWKSTQETLLVAEFFYETPVTAAIFPENSFKWRYDSTKRGSPCYFATSYRELSYSFFR